MARVESRPRVSREVKSLANGSLVNALGLGLGSAAGFATALVVAHTFGPAAAGHYFQCVALVTIVAAIASCGAEPGAMRAFAIGDRRDGRRLFFVSVAPVLLVAFAAFAAFELAAPWIADTLPQDDRSDSVLAVLRVAGVAIPFLAVQRVLGGASRGLGSNHATTLLEGPGQQAPRLLATLVAAAVGASLLSVTIAWTLPTAIAAAGLVLLVRRVARSRPDTSHPDRTDGASSVRELARGFWGFTWARGVAHSLQVTTLWLGTLLAGWLGSAGDAAVFASLSRIAIVGALVLQSINLMLAPQLAASLAREDKRAAQQLFRVATGWAVAFCFPIFVACAVYAPTLLRLFGAEYKRGATALAIVATAMLWNILTGPVTAVLLMAGRSVWNLWNSVAALAVYLAVGALLVPRFGLVGAAAAWAVAILIEHGLPLVQVSRRLGLQPWSAPTLRTAATAVGIFGVFGVAFRVWGDGRPAALVLCVALSVVVYLVHLRRHAERLELPAFFRRRASEPAAGRAIAAAVEAE
jgi:O-antigen/teichoic acid export membrane protein